MWENFLIKVIIHSPDGVKPLGYEDSVKSNMRAFTKERNTVNVDKENSEA